MNVKYYCIRHPKTLYLIHIMFVYVLNVKENKKRKQINTDQILIIKYDE